MTCAGGAGPEPPTGSLVGRVVPSATIPARSLIEFDGNDKVDMILRNFDWTGWVADKIVRDGYYPVGILYIDCGVAEASAGRRAFNAC